MIATKPDRYAPFVGARSLAGVIDVGVVVAAMGPLALFNVDAALLVGFVVAAAYATLLEGGPTGQTIGKRVVGVRVVDRRTGGPIGRPRALLRHLVRIPFAGVGLSIVLMFDPGGRTWYDWVARAEVVPARPAS